MRAPEQPEPPHTNDREVVALHGDAVSLIQMTWTDLHVHMWHRHSECEGFNSRKTLNSRARLLAILWSVDKEYWRGQQ